MASDSHTIASLKTIKICQSKFSGSRVSEQLHTRYLTYNIDAYTITAFYLCLHEGGN